MSRAAVTAGLGSGVLGAVRVGKPAASAEAAPATRMTFAAYLGQIRDVSRPKATPPPPSPEVADDELDARVTTPDVRRLLGMSSFHTGNAKPHAPAHAVMPATIDVPRLGMPIAAPVALVAHATPDSPIDGNPDSQSCSAATAGDAAAAAATASTVAAAMAAIAAPPAPAAAAGAKAAPGAQPDAAEPTPAAASAADAAPALAPAAPRTPLEQAVHDLIDQLRGGDHRAAPRDPADDIHAARAAEPTLSAPVAVAAAAAEPAHTAAASARTAVAPALAAAALAEPGAVAAQTSPSHLHLVVGDGDDRVVLTVAVRGNDVNVNVRATDDHTAAAIARNAGSLDDAMRGRGLQLAELHAERDPHAPRDRPHRERAPHAEPLPDAEPFVLEETP